MEFLRQNTAATVAFGPFNAKADALTPITNLAAPTGRIRKGGVGAAYTPAGWAHDYGGFYNATLAAGDVDTIGRLTFIFVDATTYLPVFNYYMVKSQAVYDQEFGATPPLTDKNGFTLATAQAFNNTGQTSNLPVSDSAGVGTLLTRVGTPALASLALDVAAVKAKTDTITIPPTVAAISTQVAADLATAHGSGSWATAVIPTIPTAIQISTQVTSDLAAAHGAGPWTTATIPAIPSAAQISTQVGSDLSATHGAGSWLTGAGGGTGGGATAAEIDAQLIATHGSGPWTTAVIPDIPTVVDIDDRLSTSHGTGSWKSGVAGAGGATGSGTIPVDHNTGGVDALRYMTAAGVGIGNAEVRVYRSIDYNAGIRDTADIVAWTKTDENGRWVAPLMLDPGDYTVVMEPDRYRPYYYQPSVIPITV